MPDKKTETGSTTSEQNENNKDSQSQETQPTNGQENQPTENNNAQTQEPQYDPNYVASLEARIADQQITNRRLEKLIEGVSRKEEPSTPQPRNVEEERNKFYTDPTGELDRRDSRILKEMKEMLQPIQQVANTFGKNTEYERMKGMMKSDPTFGVALKDPEVEAIVDAIFRNPDTPLDENTMKSAISQAYGAKAMRGSLNNSPSNNAPNNSNNNNNDPNNRVDPPHIPSTRTRVSATPDRKELTEDDRLAMKLAGLKPGNHENEDEYWKLISDETMTLDVHRKKE